MQHIAVATVFLLCTSEALQADNRSPSTISAASDITSADREKFLYYEPPNQCCYGASHQASNIECEMRMAIFLNRTLILRQSCVIDSALTGQHDGSGYTILQSTSEGADWSKVYDLPQLESAGLRTVSWDEALKRLKAGSKEEVLDRSRPGTKWLQYTDADVPGAEAQRGAREQVLVHMKDAPYCNWYFNCDSPEIEAVVEGTHMLSQKMQFAPAIVKAAKRVISALGEYNSVHVRRGDKVNNPFFGVPDWNSDQLVSGIQKFVNPNTTLYVSSDEKNDDWFSPLRKQYRILRLKDFIGDLNLEEYQQPFVEMLILSRGTLFVLSDNSNFSRKVAILRQAMEDKPLRNMLPYLYSGRSTAIRKENWCKHCIHHWEGAVQKGSHMQEVEEEVQFK